MKVLIVGSGGREHALAWRISQSSNLTHLWVAAGNAGTAALGENLSIRSNDVDGLVEAA
ncbi:MAG: phosphoribosylamine--glycine ligase N-terminal domain-containing protein, partial [Chloroflexota bacterium]|nr:phosphoribosylamine--glycine ligase N-terminal domain-containing protein [Chloroflexota bacterium]